MLHFCQAWAPPQRFGLCSYIKNIVLKFIQSKDNQEVQAVCPSLCRVAFRFKPPPSRVGGCVVLL